MRNTSGLFQSYNLVVSFKGDCYCKSKIIILEWYRTHVRGGA